MIAILADVYDHIPWELFKGLFFLVAGLLTLGVLILTFIVLYRQIFSRKPPLVDEIARYSASVEQLKKELSGMTPTQKFEALVEKLGAFATVNQVAALEVSLEQQLKEVRGYAHDEAHGAIQHVTAISLAAQSNSERIAVAEATLESHDRWLRDVNMKLDRIVDRTADKVQELLSNWRDRS